jgi:hypothetical protein
MNDQLENFMTKYRIRKIDTDYHSGYYDSHASMQTAYSAHLQTYREELVTITLFRSDLDRLIRTDQLSELEEENFWLRHYDKRVQNAYEKYITFCNLIKSDHDRPKSF